MSMTVPEFWRLYPFQPYELIRGEVVKLEDLGFRYGIIGMKVEAALSKHVDEKRLGEVLGANNGYRLSPNTLRSPRISFISRKKLKAIKYPYSYLPFAPDIAVEVAKANITVQEIHVMCAQYVRAGTQYVWIFQPDYMQMSIYCRTREPQVLGINDILTAPNILPNFAVPLSDLIPKSRGFKP